MKKTVILGSGESGTGAALLAKHLGHQVFVSDKGPVKDRYKAVLDEAGIEWEEGRHTLERILEADEVVKSPGIPEKSEVMKAVREKGLPVIGEIELGWRHAGKCAIVAITGSNGKTTTTELTYHLLKTAGLNAHMGGNVGNSFAKMALDDMLAHRTTDSSRVFVLEVSSFQLEDISRFRPKIAVLLNITPDHLDRYDYQMEKYAAAKFRIAMNQKRGDKFIYNAFDPVIRANWVESAGKKIAVRKGFYKNGQIRVGKQAFDMRGSALRGQHNMFNAACAVRAALLLGAPPEKIQAGLQSFAAPPHRLEKVAEIGGVAWINDSKATNVDAVFYALQAMESPTVWIVGGQDKGNDYVPLMPLVKKKVKAIVCMGLDNSKILEAFGGLKKPVVETRSAQEAVQAAQGFAKEGDTVLLSPACASFDLFKNYEDRGDKFKEAIVGLGT